MTSTHRRPLLELRNIYVDCRDTRGRWTTILHNLDFSMFPGEMVAVLGISGSGKSTLLSVIAGFLRPSSNGRGFLARLRQSLTEGLANVKVKGSVHIGGRDVSFLEPQERDIGLVMQRFSLYSMSVRRNLEFPLRMRGVEREQWAQEISDVMKYAQIREDHLNYAADSLSGGEQQRVAIGKMLLRDPHIGLFDEAFSNLDWWLRDDLMEDVIANFKKDSKAGMQKGVVFVTHNRDEAMVADRIVFLEKPSDGGDWRGPGARVHIFPSDGCGKTAWQEFSDYFPRRRVTLRVEKREVSVNEHERGVLRTDL